MVDYKEKYEVALEKARAYHAKLVTNLQKEVEDIFPELKENEDERVRKEILDYFKQFDNQELRGVDISSWITWLEKQNKELEPCEPWSDEQTRRNLMTFLNSLGATELPMSSYNRYIEYLEKQSKHTVINKNNLKIEKGKWYVCTQTFVLRGKIVIIKGQTYQAEKDNVIKGEDGCLFIDKHDGKAYEYFKAWTIQDAKPGDILATLDYILIFKESTKDDGGVSYCHYDFTAYRPQFNWLEDKNWYFGKEAKVYPATKEQRNLLFSKMEEAGYEWDADKKELKKIEQKSTEWSEEDETRLTNIIIMLKEGASHHFIKNDITKSVDWLKSLRPQKDNWRRVTKEAYFKEPILVQRKDKSDSWEGYRVCNDYTLNPNIDERYIRVKDINPQNRWKPSQKQMDALRQAERKEETNHFVLNSLIADLEKII